MVILAPFAFTIDFVRRNADYTLYSRHARLLFPPFSMPGMGGKGGNAELIRKALPYHFRPGGANSEGEPFQHYNWAASFQL